MPHNYKIRERILLKLSLKIKIEHLIKTLIREKIYKLIQNCTP